MRRLIGTTHLIIRLRESNSPRPPRQHGLLIPTAVSMPQTLREPGLQTPVVATIVRNSMELIPRAYPARHEHITERSRSARLQSALLMLTKAQKLCCFGLQNSAPRAQKSVDWNGAR